mgnify:CR=1 FL=1
MRALAHGDWWNDRRRTKCAWLSAKAWATAHHWTFAARGAPRSYAENWVTVFEKAAYRGGAEACQNFQEEIYAMEKNIDIIAVRPASVWGVAARYLDPMDGEKWTLAATIIIGDSGPFASPSTKGGER